MSLAIFNTKDGIELVIDEDGAAYTTQAGYVRMSGVDKGNFSRKLAGLKGVVDSPLRTAEIQTAGGLQTIKLIPISIVIKMLLEDYHKTPTQCIFNSLKAIYLHQNLDISGLINLHNFNKGNKSGLKAADREKQIQLAYHFRYGGQIEYPTATGRIDLLTDTTIYEFKIFRDYKNCLGQLLAYDDCVPQLKLCAVLFGVPKALRFNGSECARVESLLNKYGIITKFLR